MSTPAPYLEAWAAGQQRRWRIAHLVERLPGLIFVLIGAAFLGVIMVGASIAPGYDYHFAAISDLGVIPSTALLFNSMLIVVGALNVLAGIGLSREYGRRSLVVVYGLTGVGAIGAGIFTLDAGGLHSVFAAIGFTFFNVQALITAALLRGAVRLLGLAAGVLGLTYMVIMVIGDAGNPAVFGAIGHGGTERMIIYPVMLWLLALGGYLLGEAAQESSP